MFDTTEALVSEQSWYQGGGIRSRVVPYAIAKLAHDAKLKGRYVDFEQIWKAQAISPIVRAALVIAAERVHIIIMGDPVPVPNPLEWAKQQALLESSQDNGDSLAQRLVRQSAFGER